MQLQPAIKRSDLWLASELAGRASDKFMVSRAHMKRSPMIAARFSREGAELLETAMDLIIGANDGDPEPSGPASAMQVAA